jgi:hypothetical protein
VKTNVEFDTKTILIKFKNGKFHGIGTYSWANGAKYAGDHVEDQRTGFGSMVYPDGAEFSGIWENGVQKVFREEYFILTQLI